VIKYYPAIFTTFLDDAFMAKFMGFQNAETWTAYDRLTREARIFAADCVLRAKKRDNKQAVAGMQEALSDALWQVCSHGSGREPEGVVLLAMALLEHSVQQMAHGELLVALHWHFVGQKPGDQLELFSQD
jgi:hypothetical protein